MFKVGQKVTAVCSDGQRVPGEVRFVGSCSIEVAAPRMGRWTCARDGTFFMDGHGWHLEPAEPDLPTIEAVVDELARKALFGKPLPRTDVVNPVNGARPYSFVEFLGQRITFQQCDSEIKYHNGSPVYDGATDKAAAYANSIADLMLQIARDAAHPTIDQVQAFQRAHGLEVQELPKPFPARLWGVFLEQDECHGPGDMAAALRELGPDALEAHAREMREESRENI